MRGIRDILKGRASKKSTKYIVCGVFLMLFIMVVSLPNIILGDGSNPFANLVNTVSEPVEQGEIPDVKQISTAADLVNLAKRSKTGVITAEDSYQLLADINMTGIDFPGIGSKEFPFPGKFDGNGHTITGLSVYTEQGAGMFLYADGAVICNLKLKEANVNVTLEENVSDVPIHAGYAGALIGYSKGCAIYDCEAKNSTVICDKKNIAANVGEGLYVGGLVGVADDATVIEYSRVIGGNVTVDISTHFAILDRTKIHNGGVVGSLRNESWILDSVSSASLNTNVTMEMQTPVGVNNYFGGIAGSMQGDSCGITRCHYSGTQVGVKNNTAAGTAIAFDASGICGYVEDENVNNISYAFYNYEKLLQGSGTGADEVVSALRKESGACRDESETVKRIEEENYVYENSFSTFDFLGSTEVDYSTIGSYTNDTSTTLSKIKTELSSDSIRHINKWIIDETAHMPSHGHSFAARLDFPGAGSVTIAQTKNEDGTILHSALTTTSVNDSARQYKDDDDASTVNITATINEGYHLAGWYRTENWFQNIPYTDMTGWKEMVSETEYTELPEGTTRNAGSMSGDTNTYMAPAEDDDFYLAHFQAKIKFMSLGVNGSSTLVQTVYYDYMDAMKDNSGYAAAIGAVRTVEGIFAGWTTKEGGIQSATMSDLAQITIYGQNTVVTEPLTLYPVFIQDASSIVFATIEAGTPDENGKDNKVSFSIGDYTVNYGYNSRELKQYNNILEERGEKKERYTASVDFVNQGDGSYKCVLSLKDSKGNVVTDDSIWEEGGYRFLGWYRLETDSTGQLQKDSTTGKVNAVRVSRELQTELPTESALSGIQVFEARFEYEVQYWEQNFEVQSFRGGVKTRVEWYEYGETFKDLSHHVRVKGDEFGWFSGVSSDQNGDGVIDRRDQQIKLEEFRSTYANITDDEAKDIMNRLGKSYKPDPKPEPFTGKNNKGTIISGIIALTGTIVTEPIYAFYDHEADFNKKDIMMMTKFPDAGKAMKVTDDDCKITENEGYTFWGWTRQDGHELKGEFYESTDDFVKWREDDFIFKYKYNTGTQYLFVAHFYTNVNFLKKDNSKVAVNRRYLDSVFVTEPQNVTYTLWNNDLDSPSTEGELTPYAKEGRWNQTEDGKEIQTQLEIGVSPSDSDMAIDGYRFLGWIDAAEIGYVEKVGTGRNERDATYDDQSYMYKYIFDNPDDPFVTTDATKAEGLLWRSDVEVKVTEPMTLLPVYTYDFSVKVESNNSSLTPDLDYRIVRNNANNGFDIYLTTSKEISTVDYPFNGWYYDGKKVKNAEIDALLTDEVIDFTVLDDEVSNYISENNKKPVYTFSANFDIRTTFHDAGENFKDLDKVYEVNKVLGTVISTKPKTIPENCYFIGWTAEQPGTTWKLENNAEYYVIRSLSTFGLSQYEETGNKGGLVDFLLTGDEIVKEAMDIYPVYIHLAALSDNIQVSTNIQNPSGPTYNPNVVVATAKLGLDANGLYLETSYANEDYMLVEWKRSSDGNDWSFFTTMDSGTIKYYITMPPLGKVLNTSNDSKVLEYYRADYGYKITYIGAQDALYSHGILPDTYLATKTDGKLEYYKEVPMDIINNYVIEFGNRYNATCYVNRIYTTDGTTKKTIEEYVDTQVTGPLTFYIDQYMVFAMDKDKKICGLDTYKIGLPEDDSIHVYLQGHYSDEDFSKFYVGFAEMNYNSYPNGVNDIKVELYLQDISQNGLDYILYKTKNTDDFPEGVTIEAQGYQIRFTKGIAAFHISDKGMIKITLNPVSGHEKNDMFFFKIRRADSNEVTYKVAVPSGGTVTIVDVPFGEWVIEQDTTWSWRYTAIDSKTVTVESMYNAAEAAFSSSRNASRLEFTDEEGRELRK